MANGGQGGGGGLGYGGMLGLGIGSSLLGGLLGSSAAKKAARQQYKMFQQALAEYRKAQKEAKVLGAQAQTEIKAGRAAVRQQAETSRRESVAGQQRAETLARRSAERQAAQQQLTAYSRGMAGTTIGMGAMAAAARDVGLQGGLAAIQGAQQRGILSQQLGGQLASLRGQSAGLYQQQAAQGLQSAGQLAQLMGSYQPVVDTGLSQMLGGLGGQLFGYGMAGQMGLFNQG
jgi:hypothetical protein